MLEKMFSVVIYTESHLNWNEGCESFISIQNCNMALSMMFIRFFIYLAFYMI